MTALALAELVALAAIWGGSFLFMRIAGPPFGPFPLADLRGLGAVLLLLPLVMARGELGALRKHWKAIAVVGLTNSAIPFVCFAVASLAITAGLMSIFNATTPLWGALVAWLWLGDKPDRSRLAGLAIGFTGVLWLAWDKASLKPGDHGVSPALAIAAVLFATLLYGFSASFTRRRLTGVPPIAVAAGSQLSTALAMAVPAWLTAPAVMPSAGAWAATAALSLLCTGVAYVLYFRLIAKLGPANAISVTFLIPAFAVLWGAIFLGETLTPAMLGGCAVVLAGTSLATGVVSLPRPRAAPAPRAGR